MKANSQCANEPGYDEKGYKIIASEYAKHSNYIGSITVGATPISYVFSTGSKGVKIRVTDATQTVKIGMGTSAIEAETNASSSISYGNGDGLILEGRGQLITHFALLGSSAGITIDLVQVA